MAIYIRLSNMIILKSSLEKNLDGGVEAFKKEIRLITMTKKMTI